MLDLQAVFDPDLVEARVAARYGLERSDDCPLWAGRAATLLAGLCDDQLRVLYRDMFEERAATCEYDGGMSRAEAERIAFEELQRMMEAD